MKKVTPRKQIKEGALELKALMRDQLAGIADELISQVISRARRLAPAQRLNAIKDLHPSGIQEYKATLLDAFGTLSLDALDQARREVPAAKKVELADIDKLTPALQKKLKTRMDLLIGKQVGDLLKTIEFAYATNEDTTDSDDQIESDLRDSALGWLDGTSLSAGAEITAATIIADAREAFFFDDDVKEEIDAFQFVNGDPVTPICQDLAGTIFSKDDPNLFRYTPPLHWNCKSYIVPILKGNLGNREIQKLKPSTQKLENSIQFSESCQCKLDETN